MSSCAMSPVLMFRYHRSMEHRGKSVSYPSLRWTAGHSISLPVLMRINSVMLWWQMLPKSQGLKGTKVYFSLVCHSLLVLALFTLGSRLMELTLSGILLISEQRKREQGELGSG